MKILLPVLVRLSQTRRPQGPSVRQVDSCPHGPIHPQVPDASAQRIARRPHVPVRRVNGGHMFLATILAGALAGSATAQTPDAGCALPSEPQGIPAALDAAITGPADKDRDCMKALLIPEARLMFVSLGTDGAPTYRLETLDDWIARVKARGHAVLEEKQLKFHIERYGNIAHLWSSYALHSADQQVE